MLLIVSKGSTLVPEVLWPLAVEALVSFVLESVILTSWDDVSQYKTDADDIDAEFKTQYPSIYRAFDE